MGEFHNEMKEYEVLKENFAMRSEGHLVVHLFATEVCIECSLVKSVDLGHFSLRTINGTGMYV
jgi:hypothetical protein